MNKGSFIKKTADYFFGIDKEFYTYHEGIAREFLDSDSAKEDLKRLKRCKYSDIIRKNLINISELVGCYLFKDNLRLFLFALPVLEAMRYSFHKDVETIKNIYRFRNKNLQRISKLDDTLEEITGENNLGLDDYGG